jgi:hypothetical protein
MTIITIPKSYHEFLLSQKPFEYTETPKPVFENGVLTAVSRPVQKLLPPNTANMDLSSLQTLSLVDRLATFSSVMSATAAGAPPPVPTYFNWKEKNKNITPVGNQYLCGCCWAYSTATCISDQFVAQNILDFNPEVSLTYLMSCWSDPINNKCQGSNPGLALEWIGQFGIGTGKIHASNFSWCSHSSDCNPTLNSPSSTKPRVDEQQLSEQVPPCNFVSERNVTFFVKDVQGVPLTIEEYNKHPDALAASILSVKQHIMTYGPIVGGFVVFPNFASGSFECGGKNPSNIYLENVNYKTQTYHLLREKSIGSHAVSIIGWGEGQVEESLLKPSQPNSTRKIKVPYWIVRNSWGKEWGSLGGYFHMAQFPFNKQSQFDVSTIVRASVMNPKTGLYHYEDVVTGGIVLFKAFYYGYSNPNKIMQSMEKAIVVQEGYESPTGVPKEKLEVIYFFIALLVLVVLFFFLLVLLASTPAPSKKDVE